MAVKAAPETPGAFSLSLASRMHEAEPLQGISRATRYRAVHKDWSSHADHHHTQRRRIHRRSLPRHRFWRGHFRRRLYSRLHRGQRNIVGGRSKGYEDELVEAREDALREMSERAEALGANAVVSVDVDYEVLGQGNMLMVTASGTAVELVAKA